MTSLPIVRATVRVRACDGFTLFDQLTPSVHQRLLNFCGASGIVPLDIHDEALAISNDDSGLITSYLKDVVGVQLGVADMALAAGDGIMVALFLDPAIGERLEVEDGEKPSDMHITLAYLGKQDELDEKQLSLVMLACQTTAASTPPLEGFIAGLGRFSNPDSDVLYATPDVPGLFEMRAQLVNALDILEVPPKRNHDFTPHITIKYLPAHAENPYVRMPRTAIAFNELVLAVGGKRQSFKLTGNPKSVVASRPVPAPRRPLTLGDRIKARLGHW